MKFIISVIIMALGISTGFAQINVGGKVFNQSDLKPLSSAHIIVLNNFEKSTSSNEQGEFQLLQINKTDTLLISHISFHEQYVLVNQLLDNNNILLNAREEVLQEVAVKATQLGAEVFAIERLEPIDIYLNPVSKADPLVAVNTTASSTTKDENAAVAFRGASANATGYFLNGMPIKDPVKYAQLTNTGTLSIFNTDFLKNVTVFAGNPPLEYGQATSGAIVLEVADRFPSYGQHSASISMANLGYSFRGALNEKTHLGFYSNYQFDQLLQSFNPKNFENINSFSSIDAGLLLISHQNWGSLKFYQYGLIDNYNYQFEHPSYQSALVQAARRSVSTLNWTQEYGNTQISTIFGNVIDQNDFEFGNIDYTETSVEPYGAIHWSHHTEKHLLKTGYSIWSQQRNSDGRYPSLSYALAPEHPSENYNINLRATMHEVYSFYRWKFDKTAIGGGIRFGQVAETAQRAFAYQLNIKQQLSRQISLTAGNGKYYQVLINDSITILESNQTAIDLSYTNKRIALTQSFYANKLNNKQALFGLETSMSFNLWRTIDIDQSLSLIKNSQNYDWFLRTTAQWKMTGSWTVSTIFQSYKGLSYFQLQNVSFNEQLNVYQPQFEKEAQNFQPYQNLSLSLNKLIEFSERLNGVAFLTFNNILDSRNIRARSYNNNYSNFNENYLSRRSLYAGVILNFAQPKD